MDLPTIILVLIAVAIIAYLATIIHTATLKSLAAKQGLSKPEEGLLVWPKWLAGLVVGLLAIWLLYRVRGILLPFVVGAVIAYLLNPAIDRLGRRGWSRTRAIALVFGIFLLLFIAAAFLVIPALVVQARELVVNYQSYVKQALDMIAQARKTVEIWGQVVGLVPNEVRDAFAEVGVKIQSYAISLLRGGIGWLNRSVVFVSLLVISPIVAFWLLRDYHNLGRRLLFSLPKPQRENIRAVLRDINQVAGGYLLGIGMMAAMVAIFAVIVLSVAQVPFSVLLGILTGVLYTIPYVGYTAAVIIVALTMLITGMNFVSILIVIAIMVAGNLSFDYLLYPRVVGKRVGLHPLLVIFALLAGGALLGFAGVILAVPLAGAIKVILQHFWPNLFTTNATDAGPAQV